MATVASAGSKKQGPYSKPASPSLSMRTAMGTDQYQSNRLGAPERWAQGDTSCADGGADSPVAGAIIPAMPHDGFDCGLPRPAVSEIMGLQWGDFDWETFSVMVRRSVVHGRVGDTKTEASFRPLPVDTRLMAPLQELGNRSSYTNQEDFVFANATGRPRWQESILHRQLKPAAVRAGVGKIGWHTFRHTYSTMLRSVGTDIKVQQELLRHSTIQSTMNVYTQAISAQKHTANSKVVEMILSNSPGSSQAA